MSWPDGCRTRWTRASVQTRSTKPWPGIAGRRSSIPTRAPAHELRLHRALADARHPGLDGRPGPAAHGQPLHRAAVALAQIRGGLSPRERRWLRGPASALRVGPLLQHREAALGAGRENPGRGLARRNSCGDAGKPLRALPASPQAQQQQQEAPFKQARHGDRSPALQRRSDRAMGRRRHAWESGADAHTGRRDRAEARLFLDADVLFDMLLTAAHNPRGKAALAIELGKPGHSLGRLRQVATRRNPP